MPYKADPTRNERQRRWYWNHKEHKNELGRKRYWSMRESGLCPGCGGKPRPGKALCQRCQDIRA